MNKINTLLLAVLAPIITAGCQSNDNLQNVANNDIQCEYRAKVGSNIKKRVCLTAAQRAQEKADADEARRTMTMARGATSTGGN